MSCCALASSPASPRSCIKYLPVFIIASFNDRRRPELGLFLPGLFLFERKKDRRKERKKEHAQKNSFREAKTEIRHVVSFQKLKYSRLRLIEPPWHRSKVALITGLLYFPKIITSFSTKGGFIKRLSIKRSFPVTLFFHSQFNTVYGGFNESPGAGWIIR